jgi:hypothetical protein
MNKYRVTIARLETRIYYIDLEATSEGDARDEAWEMWNDEEDFGKGECVHSDEWVQELEVLNETV